MAWIQPPLNEVSNQNSNSNYKSEEVSQKTDKILF